MLKVFEAFSGVGSQRMALKRLGVDHEVVAISEIDEYAIMSYEAIHGNTTNLGDISKLSMEEIPEHDLFTYSFPCQDISANGLRKGFAENSNSRSSLLWECKRVIEGKRPKFLMLENVRNLISKKFIADFNVWLEWLESQGYTNYTEVLFANDFGLPQRRERVFVISVLGEHSYKSPKGQPTSIKLLDVLENHVPSNHYLSEDRMSKLMVEPPLGEVLRLRNATKLGYMEATHGDGVNVAFPTSKTRRGRVQPQCSHTLDTSRTLGVVLVEEGVPKIRIFTSLEYWRLMGFSDEDYFKAKASGVPDTELYKQAGNSIAIPVLEAVFKEMLNI